MKDDNLIKPVAEPMSDEQIAQIQNTPLEEKKSHTGLIIGLVVGFLVVGACLLGVGLVITGIHRFGEKIESIAEEDDWEPIDINFGFDDEGANYYSNEYIGNDEFGYLKADGVWLDFVDIDSNDTLQYSSGLYIVTLYAASTDKISATDYASRIYDSMKEDDIESLMKTNATIADKYSANVISGYYYDDNTWIFIWIFEAEDGKTHYVSIEGPSRNSDKFDMIDTFTLGINTSSTSKSGSI